jgi:hypothetical protein
MIPWLFRNREAEKQRIHNMVLKVARIRGETLPELFLVAPL